VDEDDLLETISHNEIQQYVNSLFFEIEDGLELELTTRVSAPPVQAPSASGCAPSSRKRSGSGAASLGRNKLFN
jgi:hypothetical protein